LLAWRIPKRNFPLLARAGAVALVALALSLGSARIGAGAALPVKNAALARPTDPFALALEGLRLRAARPAPSSALPVRPEAPRASAAFRDPKPMRPSRPAKVRPVGGAITGLFGENRGGRPHAGVDLDGEIGDPVASAGAGLVVHAGPPPAGMSGYGNVVIVNHPDGTQAMYAHLSAIGAAPGTIVEPGTLIGAVGVSGSVTGSHLHWEMRIGTTPIDPLAWLGV
jgi:murein DD-endopeptidase MepM/ murein hydrolase activator NlpD